MKAALSRGNLKLRWLSHRAEPPQLCNSAQLEAAMLGQRHSILRVGGMVAGVVSRAGQLDSTLDEAQVTVAVTQRDVIWNQPFHAEPWHPCDTGTRACQGSACLRLTPPESPEAQRDHPE